MASSAIVRRLLLAGLLLSAVLPASAQKKSSEAGEQAPEAEAAHDKDDPRARAEYLEKRRSGGKPVPRAARLKALREQQQMIDNEGKAFWDQQAADAATTRPEQTTTAPETGTAAPERTAAPPALSATQWVNIGPTSTVETNGSLRVSGRVTALAVDPSNTNTVYLGGAQGGIWKSTDAGVNWTPLTDNQASLATGSMVLDPLNSQIIYVGTGEENFGADNYYGIGILKSTNGGTSWTNVADSTKFSNITEPECNPVTIGLQGIGGGCGGLRIGGLAASTLGGGSTVLLAAVEGGFSNTGGLYRSTDGGTTWILVSGIPPQNGNRYTADSVVFVGNTSVAYAGIHHLGVFKSTDGGVNWSALNTGISNVVAIASTSRVSLTAANDGTVYAALELTSSSTLAGLFKLAPNGSTWTQLAAPADFCGGSGTGQCFYDMLVSVNPTNSNMVFIGGSGFPNNNFLYHSMDGGSNWNLDTTNIHADQHAGAYAGANTFYIGNDGGAYKATGITNSAVTWTNLNDTLGLTQFYPNFAIDPNNSQISYGGTQDNGTQKFTGDLVWNEVTCGDGASVVIDSNTGRVFANCNGIDVRESANGSAGSFGGSNSAGTGINTGEINVTAFIPPMAGDQSNPQRLYFGTNKIYQATSAASPAWSAVSATVTNGGAVTNMEASADGGTLYSVSEDGKVFKGVNMLTAPSFSDVTPVGGTFPAGNYITAVRVSPTNANTAYITLSGFGATQKIFKTINGGTSWTNVSGNLPNTPVNDLVIDPDLANTLYAATDIGVFVSANDGTTWSTMQTMLPKIAVLGMKLHRSSRTLRVATHGRGMWDIYTLSCNPAAGPCLVPSPTALNFSNQAVGTTSSSLPVTLTNNGTGTLTINGITLAGADYLQNNNCGSLVQNASCTINVTFNPRDGLTRDGSITIFSNAGSPTVIALTGIGLVVPANDAIVNGIAVTSLPFTATVITNGATTEANDPIPSLGCVGIYNPPDPLGYATSAAFNHHSIWFYYTPQTNGAVELDTQNTAGIDTVLTVVTGSPGSFAEISCSDDTANNKQSQITSLNVTAGTTYKIMVTGYYAPDFGAVTFHMQNATGTPGAPLTLSAAQLNFTALLNRPSPQSLTITNNSGSSKNITSITANGEYSVTHNCPGTLGNGASCSATVSLTATSVGLRAGQLTITDTAAGSPQIVALNGFAFNFNLNNPRPHRSNRSGNVVQGQRQQFTVALDTQTGGGTIPVSVSCANAPPGSTCSVSPSQVTAGDGSLEMTVTLQTSSPSAAQAGARTRRLGGGTPVGSYTMLVKARVGDAEQTVAIPVTVTAATPARSVRISH